MRKALLVARREILAWAMFDFANSSYTTVVVTFVFSAVFAQIIAAGPSADLWWGRATMISNGIVFLLSPLVGAIADESGRKKSFLFASYLAWFWLLTRYLAARLSVLSFLTPLFGVLCGVVFLAEPLSGRFAAAALLVAGGIVLVNLRR